MDRSQGRRKQGALDVDEHKNRERDPGKTTLTGAIRRRARDGNGVSPAAEEAVARAGTTSGSALPPQLQRKFEGALGADLGGVRVHTGTASAEAADSVNARAYTVGRDIHFAKGQYDPDSAAGEHLLAHEVAHTVQQSGSATGPQYKLDVSAPGDASEVEADRAADAMVAGASAQVSSASGVGRKIMRDAPVGSKENPASADKPNKDQRQQFLNKVSELESKLELCAINYKAFNKSFMVPYRGAWKAHNSAMEAAKAAGKAAQALTALTLNVLAAGAGGAIGGVAATFMESLNKAKPLVDGFKDLAKFGFKSLVPDFSAPALTGISNADPDILDATLDLRVLAEIERPGKQLIVQWKQVVNDADSDFDINADLGAAVQKFLTINGVPLIELKAVDNAEGVKTGVQRGLLKAWIERCADATHTVSTPEVWNGIVTSLVEYGRGIGMSDVMDQIEAVSPTAPENPASGAMG